MDHPHAKTPDRKKLLVFRLLTLSIPLAFCLLLYVGSVFARGAYSYYQFKAQAHSWAGQAWVEDSVLGYAHRPGFEGHQTIARGVAQVIRIDEHGFRVARQKDV